MILITGATGNNGGEIVKQLLAVDALVRILVRDRQKDAAKIAALEAQGVEVFQGDFAQPSSLEPALENVESALLLSSVMPNQVELQGNFINASKRAGAKHMESQGTNAEVTNTVVEVTGKEPITFDQFAQTFASTLMSRSAV